MGPFVPDVISDELNLIVGLLIGVAFGFVLEQAGFSSSRKLTGLFYGTDFTVLRVFFTAGITAMCGITMLSQVGLLDTHVIYIHPTFIYAALIGGGIMGVGFVVGGYCPGTSFCGAAIGKIDAAVFVLGGILGVFLFGEAYPWIEPYYLGAALGDPTADKLLHMTPGIVGLGMIVIAVSAFIATSMIEKKINPQGPASEFPRTLHIAAAAGTIALGFVLAILPPREQRLMTLANDEAYHAAHPIPQMSADELAFRILDKDPLVQLIDVRSPTAYEKVGLPGATNIPVEQFFGRQWHDVLGSRKRKVFIGEDQQASIAAAGLASLLGYKEVYALEGGLSGFEATILNAQPATGDSPKGNAETHEFRVAAAPRLMAMIKERGQTKPVARPVKKVVGGCGV
ncbi:MAG: YeeE/YedE family protein [Planctomycetales bacterium]|nr:YeeE/YedE family protein [Planctomycetales bacterium]